MESILCDVIRVEKNMSFTEFKKDVDNKKLKNICILWGKEQYLTEWAVGEIIRAYSNEQSRIFDVIEFTGEAADYNKIVEACETLPVISEKKLVIINNFEAMNKAEISGGERQLLSYIEHSSDTTILVLACGEQILRSNELFSAASVCGSAYEFQRLSRGELRAWIRKRMRMSGKKIEERELARFVDESGYFDRDSEYTLFHFENDIGKMVIHADSEIISMEDVETAVSGNLSKNIFDMINALGEKDRKTAFHVLDEILLYGEPVNIILSMLYWQYEGLYNVRQLLNEGKSKKEIAGILKAKDFVVGKWMIAGNKYSESSLRNILRSIYETDVRIKTGDMNERMAIELLVGTINNC